LLEGRCRFELNQLSSTSPFLVAHVRQLDSLSTSPFRDLGGNGRDDGVTADDGELGDMAASFKENARALVDKLEHRKGAARRLKSMLEQAPPHRLADLFVAAFEDSFDARRGAGAFYIAHVRFSPIARFQHLIASPIN